MILVSYAKIPNAWQNASQESFLRILVPQMATLRHAEDYKSMQFYIYHDILLYVNVNYTEIYDKL